MKFALVFLLSAVFASQVPFLPTTEKHGPSIQSTREKMQTMLTSILSAQAKETRSYWPHKAYPPIHWFRQRGIFDSFVHLNFHGEFPKMAVLRNAYRFPDDNAFVTMFVVHALLEMHQLDNTTVSAVSKDVIVDAVHAVSFPWNDNRR